jgi:hypothetical protein
MVYATGGTVTTSGGKRIHTFTSSGTLVVEAAGDVEVLVVAAGGGGGGTIAGGGGAGGLIYDSAYSVTTGNKTVTIGVGGSGGKGFNNTPSYGSKGGNSVFDSLTAVGGGGGAYYSGTDGGAEKNGGSGGGATYGGIAGQGTGGTATSGQGNAGGNTDTSTNVSGGGGGAGAVGGAGGSSVSGNGGVGLQYSISGTATYYAGGGGGGARNGSGTKGTGGLGGGGNGGLAQTDATAGTNNTGGGGGGAGYSAASTSITGGSGGSGIVIVSYAELASIAITTPANKLVYSIGDELDITGLVVTGTYSDESTQVLDITVDDISGFDSSELDEEQTLTITYEGLTTTYNIVVDELESITITTPANKLVYSIGDELDITGLVVSGTYSFVSPQVLDITVDDISGFDSSEFDEEQTLTITYEGLTTTYNVSILNPLDVIDSSENNNGRWFGTKSFVDGKYVKAAVVDFDNYIELNEPIINAKTITAYIKDDQNVWKFLTSYNQDTAFGTKEKTLVDNVEANYYEDFSDNTFNQYELIDGCESVDGWANVYSTVLTLDTVNFKQGVASLQGGKNTTTVNYFSYAKDNKYNFDSTGKILKCWVYITDTTELKETDTVQLIVGNGRISGATQESQKRKGFNRSSLVNGWNLLTFDIANEGTDSVGTYVLNRMRSFRITFNKTNITDLVTHGNVKFDWIYFDNATTPTATNEVTVDEKDFEGLETNTTALTSTTLTTFAQFTPTQKTYVTSLGIYIVDKGTGNWRVQITRASDEREFAISSTNGTTTSEGLNANITNNSWKYFCENCILEEGVTYNLKVASSVTDGTMKSASTNDYDTISYDLREASRVKEVTVTGNGRTLTLKTDDDGVLNNSAIDLDAGTFVYQHANGTAISDAGNKARSIIHQSLGSDDDYNKYLMLHGTGSYDIVLSGAGTKRIVKINTILPAMHVNITGINIANSARTYSVDYSLDGTTWVNLGRNINYSNFIASFNAQRNNTFYIKYYKHATDNTGANYFSTANFKVEANLDLSGIPFNGQKIGGVF